MTEQPTPADELRTAATRIRELAANATPGPWRQHDTHLGQYGHTATVLSGDRTDPGPRGHLRAWLPTMSQDSWDNTRNVWADSAYIAAMHPDVGSALADLREHGVAAYAASVTAARNVWGDENSPEAREFIAKNGANTELLALARAINGTEN